MKRLLCLMVLCLLCCNVLGTQAEEWTPHESRFGYSLWYSADQLSLWEEYWEGASAECFCPVDDHSGVAEMICRGNRYSVLLLDEYTRITLDEPGVTLDYPHEVTAYTDGDTIVEQWIVSAADSDYVFLIQYEAGDYQGWAPLFHAVLETLEFPFRPAKTASFLLDFFQGGAAGMRFIDVVVDEEAEPITLVPYEDMKDFRLETLVWDDETFTVSEARPIYTADPLSPGDNLNIYVYFGDVMPNLRIRYTDAEGRAQCFYLFQSGRDGSLLLLDENEL